MIMIMLVWITHAELVYDEETNSYVNTNTITETTTPVEDSTSTEEEAGTNEEESNDQISSISTPMTTSAPFSTNNRDGTLQYMHELIDLHHDNLQQLLHDNYKALLNDSDALAEDSNDSRLFALQCLSIIDDSFDSVADVQSTYEDLKNQITIVTTDLHSEVSALEIKIDEELLSQLNENLQIWSLQNKIDAYNEEYLNVVEMYYELSLDEVANAEAIVAAGSEKYKEVVALYDERVALYESMESSYKTFLEKSSIAWAVTWPNMQSLLNLLDTLEVYYMVQYNEKREQQVLTHIPANNKAFIEEVREQSRNAFSAYFNAQADSLLYGLYPVEGLQNINKGVLTIRSAYLHENGIYDCRAFVENKTIDTLWPALEKDMTELLKDLNTAANNIVGDKQLPTNADELASLLVSAIQDRWFDDIDALIAQEVTRIKSKATLEGVSWMQYWVQTPKIKRKKTVRTFLQSNYKKALETDLVDSFNTKLVRAYKKVVGALDKKPTGKTLDMLEAIKEVIEEFM